HQRRVFHGREINWSRHRARAHADDEDVMGREFDARGAREHPHTALGQAIGGVTRHRPILMHRGNVNNAPATALLDRLIICLAASWVPKNAPLRLVASTFSYCSSVVSSTEVRVSTPALLTMMLRRPK